MSSIGFHLDLMHPELIEHLSRFTSQSTFRKSPLPNATCSSTSESTLCLRYAQIYDSIKSTLDCSSVPLFLIQINNPTNPPTINPPIGTPVAIAPFAFCALGVDDPDAEDDDPVLLPLVVILPVPFVVAPLVMVAIEPVVGVELAP